jgi:hypothetical protein
MRVELHTVLEVAAVSGAQMQCWRTLKHEAREPGSATQRSVDSCRARLASR